VQLDEKNGPLHEISRPRRMMGLLLVSACQISSGGTDHL